MSRIKNILAGEIISKTIVAKQRLTAAMAWQILNVYPNRNNSKNWEIYNKLRGVLIADEVGFGKTFESLAIITKAYLENTRLNKRNFRVLIIANPAIRSKWLWNEKDSDLSKFLNQVKINQYEKEKLRKLLSSIEENSVFNIKSKSNWNKLAKNLKSQCIVLSSINDFRLRKVKKQKLVSKETLTS